MAQVIAKLLPHIELILHCKPEGDKYIHNYLFNLS